ncbi:Na/Pi-cotransporter family protein [Rhodobacterales bacterium Y4I]|nr:Na/Pi-cotransporter family protein [Rhodobacterales bacterium Y4I]
MNACLSGIRQYVAAIPAEAFSKDQLKTARSLMEYAIRLETAGDVVARRLTVLAGEMRKKELRFSRDGWLEITRMHEAILANLQLASNVLISGDLESARLLSLEKTELKRMERDSRKRHLRRLQGGGRESFDTSDIHLETLRALREFNSHIAAVAYPVLYRNGQLLETRLIENLPDQNDEGLEEPAR